MSIDDLRNQITSQLGYTTLLGSPKAYIDLTPQEQVNVTNAMNQYVVQNPSQFTDAQVGIATNWVQNQVTAPLADTSLTAEVSDFFDEVGNQASSLNQNLNPFSEQNRKYILWIVVAGAAIWYLTPHIINSLRKK